MAEREVVLAEHAGFCFGVRRAVETLERCIDGADGDIYTWGPIIHNDEVVKDFEERGAKVARSAEDIAGGGVVVVRSHGISRRVQEELEASGCETVDATCPFVKRIHRIVESAGKEGREVIVVGDPAHPEVEGIVGWASGPVTVIASAEDAAKLPHGDGAGVTVVSQTTFRRTKFQEIVEIIRQKEYDINIVDTICNATGERQEEAERLAAAVDEMIVVGDRNSSNTRKLYEICSRICPRTEFVHSPKDLKKGFGPEVKRVGITAGASTPQKIIEEVLNYARSGQQELH